MTPRDQFTHEEAVLLAKALAKAQARIVDLEQDLKDSEDEKNRYRDFWLEDSAKVKELEELKELRDAVDKVMITEGEPFKPSDLE
jgi:hypothetical protein